HTRRTMPNCWVYTPPRDVHPRVACHTGSSCGDTVLARASLEEMWRPPLLATRDSTALGDSVGLSFFVLWRGGGGGARFIGHTGHQAGFRSFFYLNPRTRGAVIAGFNTTNEADNDRPGQGFRAGREAALELILR